MKMAIRDRDRCRHVTNRLYREKFIEDYRLANNLADEFYENPSGYEVKDLSTTR